MRTLEEEVQKLVRAQGSPSRVKVEEVPGVGSLSAHINHQDKQITFTIPNQWNPSRYERIKRFVKKLYKDARRLVVQDVAFHEVGHHKLKNDAEGLGIPEDLKGKEICVDATARGLLHIHKYSLQGALYLENAIADIFDNTNCSQYTKHNGMAVFFAEQAEQNNGKFSPLYEAFVKLNMHLWGTQKQKKLLDAYYTNESRIDEAVTASIQDLTLGKNKKDNLRKLFDKSQWPHIFENLATHLGKLMDMPTPEILPGSGSAGKGYRVPAQFYGEGDELPEEGSEDVDDPMMRRLLDKDTLKKIMMRKNENGEEMPAFLSPMRARNSFYQGLASEIMIKAESPKKGMTMPIAPIQARPYDTEKDSIEDIIFGRILMDEAGKPCLAVPRSHVEYHARVKKSMTSYPDLNIAVLDNSISMTEEANSRGKGRTNIVPWGDNSKYHYALLAHYGVEKARHRLGVGIRSRQNLITFSERTQATGEKTHDEREDIIRQALNPKFGRYTHIDVGVLARQCHEPGSILMTISDSAIQNWDQWYKEPVYETDTRGKIKQDTAGNPIIQTQGIKVKEEFKRIISDKYYVHFQIGPETAETREMLSDIRKWGATIIPIENAAQLPQKAIDITRQFYTSYATQ